MQKERYVLKLVSTSKILNNFDLFMDYDEQIKIVPKINIYIKTIKTILTCARTMMQKERLLTTPSLSLQLV